MGIAESSVLDLVVKRVRSWIGRFAGALVMESLRSCSECSIGLGPGGRGFCCRCCGRLFCRKCMQSRGTDEQPKFCAFCFQSAGHLEAGDRSMSPQPVPESPQPRFRNNRFAQLMEQEQQQQQGHSPHSLCCSSCRSDEDEDVVENGKHFLSPMSDFSQDVSDVEASSVRSWGHENCSFKSVASSPLDSPSRVGDLGEYSPVKHCMSDRDISGHLRKPGVESDDRCTYGNLSVYKSSEGQKDQQPLDFENNGLIWYPPEPEEEYEDAENGYFQYDDEDDEVGESGRLFSSSDFDGDALQVKERSNGSNRVALKSAVRGHFTALVSQLLKAEGIHFDNESSGMGWLEIVSSLAWQAAHFVKPDTSNGGSMDPGNYVKVKCLASGNPGDSCLIKGVVCTKNIRHKRMISQHKNPRILILGGSLEYQKVQNKLASINAVLEQEISHIKMAVAKIEARRPNILLVEKSVSSYAQEYLLMKGISLVLNVKRSLLERISRCTGAEVVPSIDDIASARLGQCEIFRIAKVFEECPQGNHLNKLNKLNKRSMKTLMFFEGCPRRLGCTVLLKGASRDELKRLKHVVQYASFAAYHLSLETSFLVDEGASLPATSSRTTLGIPSKVMNVENCISMTASSEDSCTLEAVGEEDQGADSWNRFDTKNVFQCSDVSSGNAEILSICSGQERFEFPSDLKNSGVISVVSSQKNIDFLAESLVDTPLCEPNALNSQSPRTEVSNSSYISADPRDHECHQLESTDKEKAGSMTHGNLKSLEQTNSGIIDRNDAAQDFFSTTDSNQSILVSLSSSCILKGTVCERSQLFRIKYYGNFDKPLGRYLREDLFNQASFCPSCKESVEAHVRCYTHQHGCLSINVKRLPFMKLPGERDGKIWMWHRCLKCEYKDGVPPAAPRVIMSDAAWGLSFGKFLELSFSNHTTANRIASCGHSLQRDCLRFYGYGSMVAFFRYSPVDILSVRLPPSLMDFTCDDHQEWVKREENEIFCKMEFLHSEVFDALYNLEKKNRTFECDPLREGIQNHISELKGLLKRERNDYTVMLQTTPIDNTIGVHVTQDILQLNRLKRSLLIDSYLWDRRLSLLNSFANSKSSSSEVDSQFLELSGHTKLKECGSRSFSEEGRLCNPPKDNFSKSLASEVTPRTILLSRQHQERSLQVLECKSNNLVEMDLSIESVEGYMGHTVLSLVSSQHNSSDLRNVSSEGCIGGSSIEGPPSPGCNLSEKIDLAWTGTGQAIIDPLTDGSVADLVGSVSFLDRSRHRKMMSPVRVYSFDSGMRIHKKIHGGLSPSLRLFPVKSFDISGDFSSIKETRNMQMTYSQRSVKEVQKFSASLGHTPQNISSLFRIRTEGTRLLLPQTGHDDLVIAIYDNEFTSIIAYAIHSQDYTNFITSKSDQHDSLNVNKKSNTMQTAQESAKRLLFDDLQSQSYGSHGPQALYNEVPDQRGPHFRISFDDVSSFTADGAKFSVTCYFAKHFDALRKMCCPSEEDYIRSLSRCRRWNAQGGKSNVYFAKSWDDRFIIKQVTKTELESFLTFAPQYFKYLMDAINSRSPTCLAKVLGVYQVTAKNLKGGREVKMDLMVMENLFFRRNISRVYDLKGSLRARYNPDPTGDNKVMLDLNLLETLRTKPIFLGSRAKRCLERAVWNDTSFLASIDVMDYSLLVGVDEERKELVIGIIDFIRQYTWDKHLETWVKTSGLLGGSRNAAPTVISPMEYKKRFRKAMSNYFLTLPDQWPS